MVIEMYFHNGDHLPKLIFQRNECKYEDIYVSELREGYIKSELPYFVTSSDGHLSIATQRYSFDYYDNNHNHLKTFELAFITECEEQVTEKSVLNEDNFNLTHFTGVIVLLVMYSLILIIQRRTHD